MFLFALFAASFFQFIPQTVDTGLKGGYQVVAVDMNKDGKPDLLAVASGMSELVWYENPSWKRHVIATGLQRMINVWPMDVDKDGVPELLLAHEFANVASKSIGVVSYLRFDGSAWQIREVDRITTSHRLRSANGLFINSPLTGAAAVAPEYRDKVPLLAYHPGDFNRQLISSDDEGVVHGIYVFDWNGDGREDVLTASFRGIWVNLAKEGGGWTRQQITAGDPAAWPASGASDIAVGHLGKQRFLTSIEPWHGNQVAVYAQKGKKWQRQVIDSSLLDGHTIHTADFNGDGADEILVVFRQGARGVYLYRRHKGKWERQVISEGEVAAAGCAVADFDGDRRMDFACIGSATANLLLWLQK